jgi:hypothetical protein
MSLILKIKKKRLKFYKINKLIANWARCKIQFFAIWTLMQIASSRFGPWCKLCIWNDGIIVICTRAQIIGTPFLHRVQISGHYGNSNFLEKKSIFSNSCHFTKKKILQKNCLWYLRTNCTIMVTKIHFGIFGLRGLLNFGILFNVFTRY